MHLPNICFPHFYIVNFSYVFPGSVINSVPGSISLASSLWTGYNTVLVGLIFCTSVLELMPMYSRKGENEETKCEPDRFWNSLKWTASIKYDLLLEYYI